ncbi:MAG: hypothetical protein N2595_09940 [bacterium]|nr:hypothetical protein [bacterium]
MRLCRWGGFTATIGNLQVGGNVIVVWGTNAYGSLASDSVVITRSAEAPSVQISYPSAGSLLRDVEIQASGTSQGAELLTWQNVWEGGSVSGVTNATGTWVIWVSAGHGTNVLEVVGVHSVNGSATASVAFISDQSWLVIGSHTQVFATNVTGFVVSGTSAYMEVIRWTNAWESGGASGVATGTSAWYALIEAGEGSNHLSVSGVSKYGSETSEGLWYWVDSIAPVISEMTPTNGTEYTEPQTVMLNWVVSEPALMWVYTNEALVVMTNEVRVAVDMAEGEYAWFVVAQDQLGNRGQSVTNRITVLPEPCGPVVLVTVLVRLQKKKRI